MTFIRKIRTEIAMGWSLLDNGWKAAIRTAYQTIRAAVAVTLFAVASAIVEWASGADVNMLEVIATGRAAIGAAAIAALASLDAWRMNRVDGKGARYQ
jgi:hypothetical protein